MLDSAPCRTLATALIVLIAFALVPCATAHELLLEGDGGFGGVEDPADVAVTADGSFKFVADSGNDRVVVLSVGISGFLAFGQQGSGDGDFDQPSGIAVDSDGSVYVSEVGNDRIQRFSIADDGEDAFFEDSFPAFGELSDPRGMTVDDEDRVYVADTGHHRVRLYTGDGFAIGTIGSEGDGDGEFEEPFDVAVCALDGRVYVVDREREDVQVFAPFDDGADFLFAFGRPGSARGRFDEPSGIAVDHQCNVYVADTGNGRTQMFDAEGRLMQAFGNQQNAPVGVAVTTISPEIYATDAGADSVQQFEWVDFDGDGDGTLDDDGDGLYDRWEIDGVDGDGDGDVDLELPGADPDHKDLYVEVDYMPFHRPSDEVVAEVVAAFAAAPLDNPDGEGGIDLHVEVDDEVPHQNALEIWDGFDDVKESFFGTAAQRADADADAILDARRLVYRYGLYIHTRDDDPGSGGVGELPGDDFAVSLGLWEEDENGHGAGTPRAQAYGLMHEMGHTLGLGHGGFEDETNCKPNYQSIMNYAYCIVGLPDFLDFNPAGEIVGRLDFSRDELATLDEDDLDEPEGIGDGDDAAIWNAGGELLFGPGDGALDWDGDGEADETGVQVNLNDFGFKGCEGDGDTLEGRQDWGSLIYDFRNVADFAPGQHEPPQPDFTPEVAGTIDRLLNPRYRFQYAAKVVCGTQGEAGDGRLARGVYSTTINVHNAGDEVAQLFKRLSLSFPPEEQAPGDVLPIARDRLLPAQALKVDCRDLDRRLFPEPPAPYYEGFVVLRSTRSLDVTAVYTAGSLEDDAGRAGGPHAGPTVSIDVEPVAERRLRRRREEPPPRLPDLVVTDIDMENLRVTCPAGHVSCVTHVMFTIANQGAADAAGFEIEAAIDPDALVGTSSGGLTAGGTQVLPLMTPPGGNCFDPDCTVCVRVDVDDEVEESDEDNNERCETRPG